MNNIAEKDTFMVEKVDGAFRITMREEHGVRRLCKRSNWNQSLPCVNKSTAFAVRRFCFGSRC